MLHRITLAAVLATALSAPLAAPVFAQEDDGPSLMERGAELFFEGLAQEMAPALNDLRGMAEQFGPSMQSFLEEMGPAFVDILEQVKDWSVYEVPEVLPNGDIIIRRKVVPQEETPEPDIPKADTVPPSGATDI